jgi:N-formylglutamate amidohydrolase
MARANFGWPAGQLRATRKRVPSLTRRTNMSTLVVVHVPHASLVVPDDVASALALTRTEIEAELLAMTDRYTDELFALPATEATTVAFPVSRIVVDPERFTDNEEDVSSSVEGFSAQVERSRHSLPAAACARTRSSREVKASRTAHVAR